MKEYRTITRVAGPLVFVEKTDPIGYGDLVRISLPDGSIKNGQVLDTSDDLVVVQIFEGTSGIDKDTRVKFLGATLKLSVSKDMLGRVLSGSGKPIDGGPEIIPEKRLDIMGAAINPFARSSPHDFIQTGVSTIDAMNTLVRGQKLPIFSGSGLPHNEIALQIARQAKVVGKKENFVVIFAAMGITNEEAQYFISDFQRTGALERSVVFLNLANDPAVERLVTPKMALTAAEYFAFEHDAHVLVILTDMTNYCESLREIGAAREEIPGMIGDDITHPIPDLTGYITEGQIVLSRELHRKGVYPPIDVLPSLSRLMNLGIGPEKTRDDHKQVSDQMYAAYAEGRDLRGLVAIVGEEALSPRDKRTLRFAASFEDKFVRQGKDDDRAIQGTLDLGWNLLGAIPENELTRLSPELKKKYYKSSEEKKEEAELKA